MQSPTTSLSELGLDVVIEIGAYLDTISLVKFLSTSKKFWNLRTSVASFSNRIKQFNRLLHQPRIRPYNDVIMESLRKGHISDVFFLSNKVVEMTDQKMSEVTDSHMQQQWVNTIKSMWNDVLSVASEYGYQSLVDFFIDHGATDWNRAMESAARGGHKELVKLFIDKGANDWNQGMASAASKGHKNIVELFILKGASKWNWGLLAAVSAGNRDLIDLFISHGANNWNEAMASAVPQADKPFSRQSQEMMEFFAKKGANWGIALLEGIRQGHTEKEFISYVVQQGKIEQMYWQDAYKLATFLPEMASNELIDLLYESRYGEQ